MTNLKSLVALFAAIPLGLATVSVSYASDIEDHYRAQFKKRMCAPYILTSEEEDNEDLNADEEIIDIRLSSEEIAEIFDEIESQFNQDPNNFCNG
jgi:hypothetical protein